MFILAKINATINGNKGVTTDKIKTVHLADTAGFNEYK